MIAPPDPRARGESRQSPGGVPRRVPPENAGAIGIGGQNGTAVRKKTRGVVRVRARMGEVGSGLYRCTGILFE